MTASWVRHHQWGGVTLYIWSTVVLLGSPVISNQEIPFPSPISCIHFLSLNLHPHFGRGQLLIACWQRFYEVNFLGTCISKNAWQPSHLNDRLAGYRIPGRKQFSFTILKSLFYCFLASKMTLLRSHSDSWSSYENYFFSFWKLVNHLFVSKTWKCDNNVPWSGSAFNIVLDLQGALLILWLEDTGFTSGASLSLIGGKGWGSQLSACILSYYM